MITVALIEQMTATEPGIVRLLKGNSQIIATGSGQVGNRVVLG